MAKKLISKEPIDPMVGVYVIPDPRIYDRKILPGDPTWKELYGKIRCVRCGQKMEPGELYTAKSVLTKRGWRFNVTHHDPCEPPKKSTKFLKKIRRETPSAGRKDYTIQRTAKGRGTTPN